MPDDTNWVGKGPTPEEKAAGREPRDDGPDFESLRERLERHSTPEDRETLRARLATPMPDDDKQRAEWRAQRQADWKALCAQTDYKALRERLEDPNRGLNEWQLSALRFSKRRTPKPAKRKTRGESAEIIALFPTNEEPTS